jgi:hypothetical protein
MATSTLRALIAAALAENGETWEDILRLVVTRQDEHGNIVDGADCLDVPMEFDFGGYADVGFTAWTDRHVYVDDGYDGKTECRCVPRHP